MTRLTEDKTVRITFIDGSNDVAVLRFQATYAFTFEFRDGVQQIERAWIMAVTELA